MSDKNTASESSSQEGTDDAQSGGDDNIGRSVAKRVLAREFNDGVFTFKESDDDRAPVYQLLPTGDRANRVFVAGTVTDTEDVGEDGEYWKATIVDPTGTVYTYAGQYQPEAAATIRELEAPAYVTVVGKPRTFETDEGNLNVSIRPEVISVVDEETRDRWVKEAADLTIARIDSFDTKHEYSRMADEEYEENIGPYKEAAVEALHDISDGEFADGDESESESTSEADSEQTADDTQPA